MADLDEDTRLKLYGLKALAIDLNKQMKTIHGAVGRLVGSTEDDMNGWPADFCYDDNITVEKLWERTAEGREVAP